MNWQGIAVGAAAFLIIGALHPAVVWGEYYLGKGIWPLFAAGGLASLIGALVVQSEAVSSLFAVLGFSLFWSVRELFEQEQRVAKGWFPANPRKAEKERKKA